MTGGRRSNTVATEYLISEISELPGNELNVLTELLVDVVEEGASFGFCSITQEKPKGT